MFDAFFKIRFWVPQDRNCGTLNFSQCPTEKLDGKWKLMRAIVQLWGHRPSISVDYPILFCPYYYGRFADCIFSVSEYLQWARSLINPLKCLSSILTYFEWFFFTVPVLLSQQSIKIAQCSCLQSSEHLSSLTLSLTTCLDYPFILLILLS